MFGWIHESFRQLVNRKYGREVWLKILELSRFEEGTESEISHYYNDDETLRLVNAMANVIGIPIEEVWEAYGGFLIQFTMETGWDELLRAMAIDLEGFLDSLDSLHYFIDHVVYQTKLRGPSFRCEPQPDGTLLLHYYSKRSGLYPIVKGVVREVARRIYDTEVVMKVQERKQEHLDAFVTEHVVFVIVQVKTSNTASAKAITSKISELPMAAITAGIGMFDISAEDFCLAYPYHICFDKDLLIEHVGAHIRRSYPQCQRQETRVSDIFELIHPEMPLSYESILAFKNSLFVFKMKGSGDVVHEGNDAAEGKPVHVKGSMTLVDGGKYLLYLCSVNVTTVRELIERKLHISDMQRHDGTRDLIMLNQSRMSQVELNRTLEETMKNMKKMAAELEIEKQKTDTLLCELMPPSVAESLRQGKVADACEFTDCTLLFTDIVTFTNICAECTPYDVVTLLNDLYLRFDRLVGLHEVYKVETIGDAYMIVGGVPDPCDNHAERVLNVSIGMLMESKLVHSPITHKPIKMRIGVHCGPVVAGVVGMKMPRYCLFGDSVNVANKMEACGVPCKIHVSEPAKKNGSATNTSFVFSTRGLTEIKGKGLMFTYFLDRNDRRSVWELCSRPRSSEQTIDGYMELHDLGIYGEIEDTPQGSIKMKKNGKQRNGTAPAENGIAENGQENGGSLDHHVHSKTCSIL
ncbi:gcy-35 [Pristionchus pacificus]|nr:gcy-35 [Pristionchus pacificus]